MNVYLKLTLKTIYLIVGIFGNLTGFIIFSKKSMRKFPILLYQTLALNDLLYLNYVIFVDYLYYMDVKLDTMFSFTCKSNNFLQKTFESTSWHTFTNLQQIIEKICPFLGHEIWQDWIHYPMGGTLNLRSKMVTKSKW